MITIELRSYKTELPAPFREHLGDVELCAYAIRVTMSRVPSVNEVVRILQSVDGMTTAFWYRVTHVMHNADTNMYPRRDGEIDAWVDCVIIMDGNKL